MDKFWADFMQKIGNYPSPNVPIKEEQGDGELPKENEENLEIQSLDEKDASSSSSDVEILKDEIFDEKFPESPDFSFIHVEDSIVGISPELFPQKSQIDSENLRYLGKSKPTQIVDAQKYIEMNPSKKFNEFFRKLAEMFLQKSKYIFPLLKLVVCLLSILYLIHYINGTKTESSKPKPTQLENVVDLMDNFQMQFLSFREEEIKILEDLVKKTKEKTKNLNSKAKRLTRSLRSLESTLTSKKKSQKTMMKQLKTKVSDWKEIVNVHKNVLDETTTKYKAIQDNYSNLKNRLTSIREELEKEDILKNLSRVEVENRELKSVLELRNVQTAKTVSYLEQKLVDLSRENAALKNNFLSQQRARLVHNIRSGLGDLGACGGRLRTAVSFLSKRFL